MRELIICHAFKTGKPMLISTLDIMLVTSNEFDVTTVTIETVTENIKVEVKESVEDIENLIFS